MHSLLTVPQPRKRRREDGPAAAGGEEAAGGPEQQHSGGGGEAAQGQAAAGSEASGRVVEPAEVANGAQAPAPKAAAGTEATDASESNGDVPAAPPPAKRMKLAAGDAASGAAQPGTAAVAAEAQEARPQEPEQGQQAVANGGRPGSHPFPPSHYVLTLDQLAQHGYPLPQWDEEKGEMAAPAGFVATKASKGELCSRPRHPRLLSPT